MGGVNLHGCNKNPKCSSWLFLTEIKVKLKIKYDFWKMLEVFPCVRCVGWESKNLNACGYCRHPWMWSGGFLETKLLEDHQSGIADIPQKWAQKTTKTRPTIIYCNSYDEKDIAHIQISQDEISSCDSFLNIHQIPVETSRNKQEILTDHVRQTSSSNPSQDHQSNFAKATAAGMCSLPWMTKVTPGRTVTVTAKVWSPAVHVVFASNVSGVVTLTPSPIARAEPVVVECASSLLVTKLLLVAGPVWETVLVCVPVLVVVAVETALPEVVDTATAWKAATASSKPATSCM